MGLSLILGACATPIMVKYEPSAPAQPLKSPQKPKLFLEKVDDGGCANSVANSLRGESQIEFAGRSLSEGIGQALSLELDRLGVPVVGTHKEADAALKVEVSKDCPIRLSGHLCVDADMEMSLDVKLADRLGDPIWTGFLKGSGHGICPGAMAHNGIRLVIGYALNAALADAMGRLGPMIESNDLVAKIFAARKGEERGEKPKAEPASAKPWWQK